MTMQFSIEQNPQYSDLPAIPGRIRLMQSVTSLRDVFTEVECDLEDAADDINSLFRAFCIDALRVIPTEFPAVTERFAQLAEERAAIEKRLASSKIDLGDELAQLKAGMAARDAVYGRSETAADIAASGNAQLMESARILFIELGRTADAKALADALAEIAAPGCRARLNEISELERVLRNEVRRGTFELLQSVGRVCCPSLSNSQNPAACFSVEVSHG